MISRTVSEAPIVWKHLNGVINVFKPAGVRIKNLQGSIKGNVCKDLNALETRPPRQRLTIDKNESNSEIYKININSDLADHVLATGPRYQIEDFRMNYACGLGHHTSGVLILGINGGTKEAHLIRNNKSLRVYHVTGQMGVSTENNFNDTRQIARATYAHVWPDRLSSVLASMQASHQKKMFELCGVDMNSQAAYEIASAGLIRPSNSTLPVIYGIRCVEFKRPTFVLEIHAINEDENYLCQLVQEIGLQLHTVAHCSQIRCIRHGNFRVEDSLLREQWTLQGVISNMEHCRQVLSNSPNMIRQHNIQLSNNST